MPTARFSTDALKSAQIPVTAVNLGGRIGHEKAQNLPSLEPRADAAVLVRLLRRHPLLPGAHRQPAAGPQPDHSRISDFRLVHLDALAGLVSLGNVALDGTKV